MDTKKKVVLCHFEEIFSKDKNKKKSVLLGNGFSQALKPDIFSYGSLLDRADFSKLTPGARNAFNKIETTDFEKVIESLTTTSKLLPLYDASKSEIIESLRQDAEGLKQVLVNTIAKNHPLFPSDDISDDNYLACQKFLKTFINIYSTNYDLLLYWTGMHGMQQGGEPKVRFDDGFRTSEYDSGNDYVVWGNGKPYGQNIHYLHGGLHVFEGEDEIKKYTWVRTNKRLMIQISEALDRNLYPLIVTEGSSRQKRGKILRSEYLGKSFRSLQTAKGSMYTIGFSFSENDDHIVDALEKSEIKMLAIGIYNPKEMKKVEKRITRLNYSQRKNKIDIQYFDSKKVKIWET